MTHRILDDVGSLVHDALHADGLLQETAVEELKERSLRCARALRVMRQMVAEFESATQDEDDCYLIEPGSWLEEAGALLRETGLA